MNIFEKPSVKKLLNGMNSNESTTIKNSIESLYNKIESLDGFYVSDTVGKQNTYVEPFHRDGYTRIQWDNIIEVPMEYEDDYEAIICDNLIEEVASEIDGIQNHGNGFLEFETNHKNSVVGTLYHNHYSIYFYGTRLVDNHLEAFMHQTLEVYTVSPKIDSDTTDKNFQKHQRLMSKLEKFLSEVNETDAKQCLELIEKLYTFIDCPYKEASRTEIYESTGDDYSLKNEERINTRTFEWIISFESLAGNEGYHGAIIRNNFIHYLHDEFNFPMSNYHGTHFNYEQRYIGNDLILSLDSKWVSHRISHLAVSISIVE